METRKFLTREIIRKILFHQITSDIHSRISKQATLLLIHFPFSFVIYIQSASNAMMGTLRLRIHFILKIGETKKNHNIELNDLNHILYIDYMASIHTIFILFFLLYYIHTPFFAGPLSMYKLSIPLHISHWLCIVINIILYRKKKLR